MQFGSAILIFRFFWMIGNLSSGHDCPFWDHNCDRMARLLRPRASPSEGPFGFKPASHVHIFLPLFFVHLFARSVRSWDTHRSSSNSQGHSCRDGSCRIRSFDDNTPTPKGCHVVEDVFPNGWDGGRAPRLDLWAAPTACRVSCVVCVGAIWRGWVGLVSFHPTKGQAQACGPTAPVSCPTTSAWNVKGQGGWGRVSS